MTTPFDGLTARLVLVIFALGGIAEASAAPVRADDGLAGTYSVVTAKGERSTWTVESSCTPSCVASVHSSQGWIGYAKPADGRWTMAIYLAHWNKSSYAPDPADCPTNASDQPLNQTWSWDAATLTGTVETVRSDQCVGPVTMDRVHVRLVKAGEGDG